MEESKRQNRKSKREYIFVLPRIVAIELGGSISLGPHRGMAYGPYQAITQRLHHLYFDVRGHSDEESYRLLCDKTLQVYSDGNDPGCYIAEVMPKKTMGDVVESEIVILKKSLHQGTLFDMHRLPGSD